MKEWNERRLNDFFRMNFDKSTCQNKIQDEKMIVVDEESNSIRFEIKNNKIYSPDTQKYYI